MKKTNSLRDMTRMALCAALMTLCAWISIPAPLPFTLQTLGIFLTASLLGSKKGCLALAVYLLLGAAGLPVFSGMKGSLGALLGPTGGFLLGFLPAALLAGGGTGGGFLRRWLWMLAGLAACYLFGTLWYGLLYLPRGIGWGQVLQKCVVPFLLPDMGKAALAALLAQRIAPRMEKK